MADTTSLQGAPSTQQQASAGSLNIGPGELSLQNQGITDSSKILQASPSTLAVVGPKQADALAFPVTDVAVLGVILIVVIIGVVVWSRD